MARDKETQIGSIGAPIDIDVEDMQTHIPADPPARCVSQPIGKECPGYELKIPMGSQCIQATPSKSMQKHNTHGCLVSNIIGYTSSLNAVKRVISMFPVLLVHIWGGIP
jgi:hypothetical protein